MRQLQNEYRRTQTNAARLLAVHAEKYVDNLIENALDDITGVHQPELTQRPVRSTTASSWNRLWKME
jgi:hypothetical protein